MQFIDLQTQYRNLKKKIDKRVLSVLNEGSFIMGPEVDELEEKLASYVGVKHVVTCANGTDALTLALMVLGIKKNDAVYCPTFTFFASAEVIAFAGATPVFVDSNKQTFNICPIDLENQIKKTITDGKLIPKAIIAVDLFGLPADYIELERIAKKYNLKLIEDAAQAFGGSINGKKTCSFGDIATTSFFPAKPLGCYGDGGAVFTDDDDYAALLKSYQVHGKGLNKYDNVRIGMNSRLDTIQAAILLEKLEVFPIELISREKIAENYNYRIQQSLVKQFTPKQFLSSWALYTIVSENREQWMQQLQKSDIPCNVYYGRCMHQQLAFKYLNYKLGDFPVAEYLSERVLSLPMHPYLSADEISSICNVFDS